MLFQSTPIPGEGMANLVQYWVHHSKNPREEPNANKLCFGSIYYRYFVLYYFHTMCCHISCDFFTCNVER